MEAANSTLQHLKLVNVYQKGHRKHSSLYWKREDAFYCNVRTQLHYTDETSQRINRSFEIVPLLHHISSNSNRIVRRNCMESTYASMEASSFSENVQNASDNTAKEKVGVLLLNLGGPETLDDVQPFLFNLFADPDIIRLPRLFRFLQKPLAKLISTLRAPKSKEAYASIGGGSPLRKITDEQAQALKVELEVKGLDAYVYVAMRYWHPFTEEAIHQIKRDGITKLVILPLYPQFSISTSGSSIRLLQCIFREDDYFTGVPISIIESWYQRKGYVKSMADLIENELLSFSEPEEVMIFFSAHGVPLSYVENAGDPYRDQMEDCVSLVMDELKSRGVMNNHTLAYQSRVGPVQWLKPYTDEVLVELGQRGVQSLLTVPISFISEHIETLEEIDMEYKQLALEAGIANWGRVPALGCTPSFISDLADAVMEVIPCAAAATTTTTTTSVSTAKSYTVENPEKDLPQYLMSIILGSILGFFLLFSPRLVSSFKNNLL